MIWLRTRSPVPRLSRFLRKNRAPAVEYFGRPKPLCNYRHSSRWKRLLDYSGFSVGSARGGSLVRHALIHKRAVLIDQLVDTYKTVRRRHSFPHRVVAELVGMLFPGSAFAGRGAWKTVHRIASRERDLVLKTGNRRSLHQDWRAYRR